MIKPFLIAHLCLAFTLFLAALSDPYLGEHYRKRENQVRLLNLKGDPSLSSTMTKEDAELLAANQELWAALPESERTFFENAAALPKDTVKEWPSFLLIVWAAASVILSVFVLKGRQSGEAFFFIIPLLSLLIAMSASHPLPSIAIPSEAVLAKNYLKNPIEGTITEQMELLRRAFHLYLIEEWGKETPDSDPYVFKRQVQKGMFTYNKAQLKQRLNSEIAGSGAKAGPFALTLFVLWNAAVFLIVARSRWRSRQNTRQLQAQ